MKTKSNKIKDVLSYIDNELKNVYPKEEITAFKNILFDEYADMNSAHLLAFMDDYINESSLLRIVLATEKLKKQVPIQYILHHTQFLDLNISLTTDVLIPRPETEELVSKIITENKQRENLNIIDLCTGSGCIGLALNKFLKDSKVMALDVSPAALEVVKKNNKELGLVVETMLFDLLNDDFSRFETMQPFDIIVSNPPYVMNKEKKEMQKNVLNYEPHLALFVKDENPLVFYKKIAFFAQKFLKKGGKVYLEINNSLSSQTLALFSQTEFIARIEKDIFDKERFIFLEKK